MHQADNRDRMPEAALSGSAVSNRHIALFIRSEEARRLDLVSILVLGTACNSFKRKTSYYNHLEEHHTGVIPPLGE